MWGDAEMVFDQRLRTYLKSLPADEAAAWEQRLEWHRRDCGCRVGSVVLLSTIAVWIVYSFLSLSVRPWQRSVGIGILILFASGLVGKLIGLGLAQVRFNLTVRRLRKRICAETAKLARDKSQSDLILEAIKTGGKSKADANLPFFIDANLIDDPTGAIGNAIKAGTTPVLPAPVAEAIAERAWIGADGQQVDFKLALDNFRIAAAQGNCRAMANLGWMYENGFRTVTQDYGTAKDWYLKAANCGDVIANWNMARLYERGMGVTKDLGIARTWYEKRADRHEPCKEALNHLGNNL